MANAGETTTIQRGPRGGRVLPDGSRVISGESQYASQGGAGDASGGGDSGGGGAPSPQDSKKKWMIIGGVTLAAVVALYLWRKNSSSTAATAATTAAVTAASTDPNANIDSSTPNGGLDPWQFYGTNPSGATGATGAKGATGATGATGSQGPPGNEDAPEESQPALNEKIGSGYYTRGADTPKGHTFLTPALLRKYKGPYYYEPTIGKMVKMTDKSNLEAETPLYTGGSPAPAKKSTTGGGKPPVAAKTPSRTSVRM
jgi:hypothetical protein